LGSNKLDDKDREIARLKSMASESRLEAETLRASLRFQIGDALVGAMSSKGGALARLHALGAAAQRGRALLAAGKVRNVLFSGLPSDGLPATGGLATKEARAVLQYALELARAPAKIPPAPAVSGAWAKAAVELAQEMAGAIPSGYPLPQKSELKPVKTGHILYLSRHHPAVTQNGYARRTFEIAKGLAAAGHTVTVGVTSLPEAASETLDGILYKGLAPEEDTQGLHSYVEALSSRIAAEAQASGADIIHAASNYLIGLAALSSGRQLALPVVYEVRGLWEETRRAIDTSFGESLGYKFQAAMESFCVEESDAAIAGSPGIAAELVRRGADAKRLRVAASGAASWPTESHNHANAWRKKFPSGAHIVGFVGSITSYEGLDTMASALAKLNQGERKFHFLIAGGGPYLAEARQIFSRQGVDGYAHFAGALPFAEIPQIYGAIDLLAYPRASLPVTQIVESLKPVEGLAAGIPVIMTRLPPSLELRHNCPGVIEVNPGDASGLAHEIEKFFTMPGAERDRIGQAAREWVLAHRSWDQTVRVIRDAYTSIPD
jgi:glycosyltransferase involved in cell wall biosynthesis